MNRRRYRPFAFSDRRQESALRAAAGLLSPRTGIVDAHALCLSYAAEAESRGAQIAFRTRVVEIDPIQPGFRVTAVGGDGETSAVTCAALVNAGGELSILDRVLRVRHDGTIEQDLNFAALLTEDSQEAKRLVVLR